MLRPLALIGTVGMMAMIINTANAQQDSVSFCCDGCLDKGWNPPARLPVNRDGIWYRNYWPKAWYGNSGGGFISNSPMVYQPTDTTQLGHSYAKVPTWQAKRMIPPTPCPSQFHSRVCVPSPHCKRLTGACQSCQSCQNGCAMNTILSSETQQLTIARRPLTITDAGVMNAALRQTRPASGKKKKQMFRLTRLKYLFD